VYGLLEEDEDYHPPSAPVEPASQEAGMLGLARPDQNVLNFSDLNVSTLGSIGTNTNADASFA
jgi:hypothetical protein